MSGAPSRPGATGTGPSLAMRTRSRSTAPANSISSIVPWPTKLDLTSVSADTQLDFLGPQHGDDFARYVTAGDRRGIEAHAARGAVAEQQVRRTEER